MKINLTAPKPTTTDKQLVVSVTGRNLAQDQRLTLTDDLFSRFIAYLDAKPKTIQTYSRALKQFYKWIGERGIRHPEFTDVKAYRDELKQTCKPATVQTYIFTVRRFFEWTESEGLYPNVAGKIKGARIDREPKKDYLTAQQARALLESIDRNTLKGLRDFAILSLMITGGLRDIEIQRADVQDLQPSEDGALLYVQGKGHDEKNDFVIIPAQTYTAITTYLQARGDNLEHTAPLFVSTSHNRAGERISTRSISAICKTAMISAGFNSDRLTAHSLRHTAITLALLANGGNIQEAQQFARHSNVNTTQIYAHNLDKKQNACSRLVAHSIFS